MAKFSPTLHGIGDPVTITDGAHKGHKGTVTDWGKIHADNPDTIHHVTLDAPHEYEAENVTQNPDGSKTTRTEKVSVSRVDVPASALSAG